MVIGVWRSHKAAEHDHQTHKVMSMITQDTQKS